MLLVLLSFPLASSLTVQQGVEFVYGNVTTTFENVVDDLETITIENYFLKLDDDNFSFNPGSYDLNISVYSYTDNRNNNLYMIGEGQNVDFTILSDGLPSSIIFNDYAYLVGFTSPVTSTKFTYYSDYNISVTFKDEQDQHVINDRNISVTLIGEVLGNNYTVENGYLNLTNLVEDNYVIMYSADNYTTRFYYLNYYNSPVTSVTLYLTNASTSTEVTINVYDKTGFKLVGATVKVLKYFVDTHSYELVETSETNFQGSTTVNINLNNNYYQFIIEYGGNTVYLSSPTIIYSTTLNFYVDITQQYLNDIFSMFGLSGALTFTSNADYGLVGFVYDDTDNIASNGCVYAYKLNGGVYDYYNHSCINVSAGSVTTNVNNESGSSYKFIGYITKQGVTYKISSAYYTYGEEKFDSNAGLWLMFIIMVAMALLFFANPIVGVVLTSIVPLVFQITGIYCVGYEVAVPLFVTGIIVGVIMGGNR